MRPDRDRARQGREFFAVFLVLIYSVLGTCLGGPAVAGLLQPLADRMIPESWGWEHPPLVLGMLLGLIAGLLWGLYAASRELGRPDP